MCYAYQSIVGLLSKQTRVNDRGGFPMLRNLLNRSKRVKAPAGVLVLALLLSLAMPVTAWA